MAEAPVRPLRELIAQNPVHTFHIAVMGIGFTIDTPYRVAKYGISSVISLVDDTLIEQIYRDWCAKLGEPCEPIENEDPDPRARRIARYLNLVKRETVRAFEELRHSTLDDPRGIRRYIALLPDGTPLKDAGEKLLAMPACAERDALEREVREALQMGSIDVNIMTKLDRGVDEHGEPRKDGESDAVAALRGFAMSELEGAVILSAGLNPKVSAAIGDFDDFFPLNGAPPKKRVILKVSDLRSAQVQGKMLSRRGVWVSEYRIESGLNCGGHAFPTEGVLLGPILESFKNERASLADTLFPGYAKALVARGLPNPDAVPPVRVTVQGGIGTYAEDRLLMDHYAVEGTGWASPFLLCPEVTNVTPRTREALAGASMTDVRLTWGSPLGVPFWSLRTSGSEVAHRQRIAEGRPGSKCPKGLIALDHEYGKVPLCKAARGYQRRKLADLDASDDPAKELVRARILAPTCICHDLGGDVKELRGIEQDTTPSICPGPNVRWFKREFTLDELVGHIYGRTDVLREAVNRPHQLVAEAELYVEFLERELAVHGTTLGERTPAYFKKFVANFKAGLAHTRTLAPLIAEALRPAFERGLSELEQRVDALVLPEDTQPAKRASAPVAAE
jgi:hypothetical protein